MKRYKLFLIVLPLFLIFGLTQGCDKDNGGDTTTTTTPTTPTPTATPTLFHLYRPSNSPSW